jgi:hypothetical protein
LERILGLVALEVIGDRLSDCGSGNEPERAEYNGQGEHVSHRDPSFARRLPGG